MIRIESNIIPFKGFVAICLWPFLFIRKENRMSFTRTVENHEEIHAMQQQETILIGCILALVLIFLGCGAWSLLAVLLFYWIYLVEWLVKLVIYRNAITAYKNVSFENEAYKNQTNLSYLQSRKPFAWINYF